MFFFFFFQAEDGIRDADVTGVQTCASSDLPGPKAPSRKDRAAFGLDKEVSKSMRRILLSVAALGLLIALGPSAVAASSVTNPLVQVSGPSPFADCPPADLDAVLPKGEVEPNVAVNPTNPANVVGVWMQDRFRGLVAVVSLDGGATWRQVVIPGLTQCTSAQADFDYAFDPWVSFGPGSAVYLSASVFGDAGAGRILVSKSTNGGLTWSNPVPLITETHPMVEDHGDSITADPTDKNLVYGV